MPSHDPLDAPPEFYRSGQFGPQDSWAYLMRQLVAGAIRQIGDALAPWELPSVQWMPLMRLSAGQRCTVVALARDLGVDAATMTRATDRLAARGWVERQRSCTDRRLVELHITPAGQQAAQQLRPVLTQVLNIHLAGFSEAEWLQLMGLLNRMQANALRMAPMTPVAPLAADTAPGAPAAASDAQALDATQTSSSIRPPKRTTKRRRQDTG